MNLLLEPDGSPLGGKWSYDAENRKKLPKKQAIPGPYSPALHDEVISARKWVTQRFPSSPGPRENFTYPTNRREALEAMALFFNERFELFGDYEDAISARTRVIFHPVTQHRPDHSGGSARSRSRSLMILGNFMLLCRIHPDAIYRWFMELYIDAYDWVMVPNVYAMSQFADGGVFSPNPYLSGSNYIRKMSDFPKGHWCDPWDGLYWMFIEDHHDFFASPYRLSMMVHLLKKMPHERRRKHRENAENFLSTLDRQPASRSPASMTQGSGT